MQKLSTQLFTAGFVCLIGTISGFWVIVPLVVDWQVTERMRLEKGNDVWQSWENLDATILFKVYVFNVTNPQEVFSGADAKVEEVGPYIYEEKRFNTPIEIDVENDQLKFQPTVYFYFRPDLSNGTEEDVITILNIPLVSAANELKTLPRILRYMGKTYINTFGEKLFIQRTPKLLFFQGVHSEMIESFSNLIGIDFIPNNTFGLFYEKNGTLPFEYQISTGLSNPSKLAQITSINGKSSLDIWNGDSCNTINGSESNVLFPPFVTKDTVIYGWEWDICRSTKIVYQNEETFNGVHVYRFGLPKNFFASMDPENECFCTELDKANCPVSGALSISACKFGSPLLISHPYFLYGDPSYNEKTGLKNADPNLHESYGLIEPKTGVPLEGHKRLMVSIQISKSADVPELHNVKDAIIPLFWVDEDARPSLRILNKLYWEMVIPLLIVEIVKWSLLVASSTLLVIGAFTFVIRVKYKTIKYEYEYDFANAK